MSENEPLARVCDMVAELIGDYVDKEFAEEWFRKYAAKLRDGPGRPICVNELWSDQSEGAAHPLVRIVGVGPIATKDGVKPDRVMFVDAHGDPGMSDVPADEFRVRFKHVGYVGEDTHDG